MDGQLGITGIEVRLVTMGLMNAGFEIIVQLIHIET
jgi:hypothetical protein